jgi:phosphoribosyl-dephospho-CoA transferase
MIENLRAHDLLRINTAGISALTDTSRLASVPLKEFPFVVVRRMQQKQGLVPIGIRGKERHERYAAWLDPQYIVTRVAPESIKPHASLSPLAAFGSLLELQGRWREVKLAWGPGGSIGFELVSGCPVVHERSDLDLIVRAPTPLSSDCLRMLAEADNDLPCAIDIQVETPYGAFSLKEYVGASARCLLRTIHGPQLVADPWSPPSTVGAALR